MDSLQQAAGAAEHLQRRRRRAVRHRRSCRPEELAGGDGGVAVVGLCDIKGCLAPVMSKHQGARPLPLPARGSQLSLKELGSEAMPATPVRAQQPHFKVLCQVLVHQGQHRPQHYRLCVQLPHPCVRDASSKLRCIFLGGGAVAAGIVEAEQKAVHFIPKATRRPAPCRWLSVPVPIAAAN